MHTEAMEWVRQWAPVLPVTVLDVGGRDVNGTPVECFHPDSSWTVVDLHPADNVDWVGDFLAFGLPVDITSFGGMPMTVSGVAVDVVCHLEVAEHCAEWVAHMRHARDLLTPGGQLILTAAGPGRAPHSAIDGGPARLGEWYQNVNPDRLADTLEGLFQRHIIDVAGDDVRAVAWR